MLARFCFGPALRRLTIAGCSLAAVASCATLFAAEASVPRTAEARKEAAEALLEEALIAEVDGRGEDREAILAKAEALAPDLPLIRWHRGMVLDEGKWIPAEDVAVSSEDRTILDEYAAKRDAAENSLAEQFAMAKWCQEKDLPLQEQAHLTRVLAFAPDHEYARTRLGYVRVGDEWIGREEIGKAIAEAARTQASMKKHAAPLHDAVRSLGDSFPAARERAADAIRTIRDPEAIPALEAAATTGGEQVSLLALDALAAMPEDDASLSLARFAVLSPVPKVRRNAAEALRNRDLEDYVPPMIASMTTPIRTEFQVARRLDDRRLVFRQTFYRESMRSAAALVVDTTYVDPRRLPATSGFTRRIDDAAAFDMFGKEALRQAFVRLRNADAEEINDRFGAALETATGESFGADAQRWWDWWDQYEEVSPQGKKPVDAQYVSEQTPLPVQVESLVDTRRHSCFAAGTPVLTNRGDVSIEQVRAGDLVLSQNVETGELAFKPVLDTTVGPPTAMLRVEHEEGSFRCTGGHPFWVSGEGWINARRLKSGMELHTARGSVRVSQVVADDATPTYNLIVADFSTYFVDQARILCHDISSKDPTDAIVPGLAQR